MKIREFFDKLWYNMSGLLKNGSERWSSIRFAFLLSVIFSNIVIFGIWATLSIMSLQMIIIPESVLILYCLANGIATTGKIWQKNIETKKG
jgi:hypothetical protein